MKESPWLILLAALSLTACNEQNNSNSNNGNAAANSSNQGHSLSVFAKLRPQADANMVAEIQGEEEAARRAKQAEQERQMRAMQQQQSGGGGVSEDPSRRNLPGVASSSFAGNLPGVNGGAGQLSSTSSSFQAGLTPEQQKQFNQAMNWTSQNTGTVPSAQQTTPPPPQNYGINYTTPSPGFVPPPPAVSLSTAAVPMGYGGPPQPDYNPYATNPYGYGMAPPGPPPRSANSGFGQVTSGALKARPSSDDDDDAPKKKKDKPMQIITPTGMEARSAYKQRDELRLLWKGALATSLSGLNQDAKLGEGIAKIDVGLPGESSKGTLSIAQRQIDAIFKNNGAVDKKVIGTVKKTESDLAQAYYRYLYAYNKFFLTQQQVQARKQELDCADTQNEKQRATVDLANSSQEADASKDDMRSAQNDLAAVVGAAAARTVIKNVSGVTPSLEIAQADASAQSQDKGGEGGLGGIFNVFGFGKGKSKEKDNASVADDAPKVAAETKGKEKKEKEKDVKEKKKGKGDKDKQQIAAKPQSDAVPAPKSAATEPASPGPAAAAAPAGPVSFELKDVKTTPRKSVLRVVVKNVGGDNFSFDADSISVAEGNTKLAEASVNAEFDSTIVQPSQEVTGTITIFGRPWNDKLTVSLSNGNRPIFLHR